MGWNPRRGNKKKKQKKRPMAPSLTVASTSTFQAPTLKKICQRLPKGPPLDPSSRFIIRTFPTLGISHYEVDAGRSAHPTRLLTPVGQPPRMFLIVVLFAHRTNQRVVASAFGFFFACGFYSRPTIQLF